MRVCINGKKLCECEIILENHQHVSFCLCMVGYAWPIWSRVITRRGRPSAISQNQGLIFRETPTDGTHKSWLSDVIVIASLGLPSVKRKNNCHPTQLMCSRGFRAADFVPSRIEREGINQSSGSENRLEDTSFGILWLFQCCRKDGRMHWLRLSCGVLSLRSIPNLRSVRDYDSQKW
jgi:hypothetical protein